MSYRPLKSIAQLAYEYISKLSNREKNATADHWLDLNDRKRDTWRRVVRFVQRRERKRTNCWNALVALNEDDQFDYISTSEDRAKFAPKLATDELQLAGGSWCPVGGNVAFLNDVLYRRRKKPVAVWEWRLDIKCVAKTDWPIVCILANGQKRVVENCEDLESVPCNIEGWTPLRMPPDPMPESWSGVDKAWKRCNKPIENTYQAFKAGYEAAKVGGVK